MNVKGMDAAKQAVRNAAKVMAGTLGDLYPNESTVIIAAIKRNADKSYHNSPALTMATDSAKIWTHSGRKHKNDIYSTNYANLRQYCQDKSKRAILVDFTGSDITEQIQVFIDELARHI